MDWTAITGGGLLLLAGGAWYATKPKATRLRALGLPTSMPADTATRNNLPAAREGLIAIARDPHILLAATGSLGLVTRIQENLGLSPEQYKSMLKPAIDAFALYVQMLPASESHHHANPGGLLQHLLESASNASKLTQSYKLPKGAATEQQHKYKTHWAVGITLCALLHDVGKPIANQGITLHSQTSVLRPWDGLSGAMTQYAKATHYAVVFEYAPYDTHTRLPVILLQSLVNEKTRQWLEQAPGLLPAMMTYLDGKATDTDAIKEIVTLADQHSTKENLAAGPKSRFASARAVPAIERMLGGLRGAIADEELALNRAGAAGFVDTDGEHVYFVAGVVVDAARKWLDANETRNTGAAGLPKDNSRWFDTFQEHGALVAHPSGGSIWPIQVAIPKPDGGDWSMRLTTLKFRVQTVFAANNLPAPLDGTVTPELTKSKPIQETAQLPSVVVIEPPAIEAAQPTETVLQSERGLAAAAWQQQPAPAKTVFVDPFVDQVVPEPAAPLAANVVRVTHDPQADYAALERMMGMDLSSASPTPEAVVAKVLAVETHHPATPEAASAPANDEGDEFLSPAIAARMDDIPTSRSVLASPPVRAADEHTGTGTLGLKTLDPAVNQFLIWLQNGISRGDIPLNQSTGIAHVVPEGLALLSPRVFMDFVEQNPHLLALLEPNVTEVAKETKKTDKTNYKRLQRRVENSGYLLINTSKSKLHTYHARTDGAKMHMIVLGQPQRFFHGLPPENTRITRSSPPIIAI